MKSRPCGWVFRLSRVSRAVRERRLPRLRGLAGPSYESRLAVCLQSRSRRSAGYLVRLLPKNLPNPHINRCSYKNMISFIAEASL